MTKTITAASLETELAAPRKGQALRPGYVYGRYGYALDAGIATRQNNALAWRKTLLYKMNEAGVDAVEVVQGIVNADMKPSLHRKAFAYKADGKIIMVRRGQSTEVHLDDFTAK